METQTLIMTPAQWAKIPGNPRQRNTAERVKRAKHLFVHSPEHEIVKMASLSDGRLFKIDGHTRDLFWQLRPELAPPELLVVDYQARDLNEVFDLYDYCDSSAALETAVDKVYGSFRENGFQPVSAFMQTGRITAALRLAYSVELHMNAAESDVHKLVAHWLPELKLLDRLSLTPYFFNGAVLTAALLTMRRHGVIDFLDERRLDPESLAPKMGRPSDRAGLVVKFWEAYSRNEGTKQGLVVDPIEALRRLIETHRETHNLKRTMLWLTAGAVACVERHLRGRTYKINETGALALKGVDLAKYFPPRAGQPAKPETLVEHPGSGVR